MRRVASVVVAGLLVGTYSPAAAQDGAGAQAGGATLQLALDGGLSQIHGAGREDGIAGRVSVLWALEQPRLLRIGGHLGVGTADEDYLTIGPALEIHPLSDARLSPFLAARVGLLAEPEFGGLFLAGGLGLELRLGTAGVRAEISRGVHGGEPGPHEITLGVRLDP